MPVLSAGEEFDQRFDVHAACFLAVSDMRPAKRSDALRSAKATLLAFVRLAGAADRDDVEGPAFDGYVAGLLEARGVDEVKNALQRVGDDDAIAGDG
jgi:hypothetical protein